MVKNEIIAKLIEIKRQVSELGISHVENEMPIALSDISFSLRPFTAIDTAINAALKKLSEVENGCIPKQNTLKNG
ncbi:hypothetical protein [Flavobacterium anhuiense]|uniref:hypothetical protein n=1 Tax=Flavobacterium anhuiense TaxID=459526 RepID=UPI0020262CA4|nr:hypothetical protein [Flavobacterium anhuiense]URM37178.1 hypothetical protein LLY39_00875 [Flavobacterium anhuiense]